MKCVAPRVTNKFVTQRRVLLLLPRCGLAFEKGMKMHTMSHLKMHSLTTYHILLVEFEKNSIKLCALKCIMGFQQ